MSMTTPGAGTTGAAGAPGAASGGRDVMRLAREVGQEAAPYAASHDVDGSFVTEGYQAVRDTGYGRAGIPIEFGGDGADLWAICRAQALLARYCVSTALAITMHHHNALTMAWRWRTGDDTIAPMLKRVAAENLVIATSGTLNPARISVTGVPVDGGIQVSGAKRLCSGAPGADVLSIPVRVDASDGTTRVVGLMVPLAADGVEIVDDWQALGMRASGTNTVEMTRVFVPEENIVFSSEPRGAGPAGGPQRRPGGPPSNAAQQAMLQRGMRMPGLHISLPMIAAVYLGAAGQVRNLALKRIAGTARAELASSERLAGMMTAELRTAWWILESVVREATDDALGSARQAQSTLIAKRQIIVSSINVVEAAMEMVGSISYLRDQPFERALRDIRAGVTHPLPPEQTLSYLGHGALQWALNAPELD
jgi:acyl-CoA dehydrogenase